MLMYRSRVPSAAVVDLARAAALFHALSDPTRLAILERLRGGEHCVCDLQDLLDAGQSRLSFHLRVLKDAGLVVDRKEGRWSYYALEPAAFDEGRAFLAEFGAAPRRGARSVPRVVDTCCR
ncbi:hypothetical protein tb265_20880 [Gemmatimonadetes bacterium T265]|nr:hypothetical protein tb265_20880 [Gemmatimonadetes bacterium T265]